MKIRKSSGFSLNAGAVLLLTLSIYSVGRAQQAVAPETIHWIFPLERAAERMEQLYARPVTYEDPMRVWRGEMEVKGHLPNGSDFLTVKPHSLILPEWPSYRSVPSLNLATINDVVKAYAEQNPSQPLYSVVASKMGFHIIPTRANDAFGNSVPTVNAGCDHIGSGGEPNALRAHCRAMSGRNRFDGYTD